MPYDYTPTPRRDDRYPTSGTDAEKADYWQRRAEWYARFDPSEDGKITTALKMARYFNEKVERREAA